MKSGILLIDKEAGVTSRYVDNAIQRLFDQKGVGHLGTLDPFATGLLLVAVGKATKYLPYLSDEEKTYEAKLILGEKSSTGDRDGEIIESKPVPELSLEEIQEVLHSFLGESSQIPPMTSAIKKDGVAFYKLAREGKEIERESRKITVYEIALLSFKGKEIAFRVKVSKGTYIRVLGEDIASKLGTVGYLQELRRTAIGDLRVENALKLSQIKEGDLLNPALFVANPPRLEVDEEKAQKIKNGVAIALPSSLGSLFLTHKGEGLAIVERQNNGVYKVVRGLF